MGVGLAVRPYFLAIADRAGRTAVQVAVGYVVTNQTMHPVDWRTIGLAVALAVIVSVAQSLVDFPAIPGGWWADITARALRTFAHSVTGSIGASLLLTDVPWATVLTAAALAALSSVITSSAATPFGPASAKGTPALTPLPVPGYVGYSDAARHLQQGATHTVTAVTAGIVAALAFAGITTAGAFAAHTGHPQVAAPAATAAAPPPAPPVPPPAPPDRSPAYLAALQRDGVPTPDRSKAALILVAGSVCTQRSTLSDAQQTDRIMAGFSDKWTREQVSVIVDDAIAAYCD